MVGVWTVSAPVALALVPLAPAGGSVMSADSTRVSQIYYHDNVPMLSLRPSRRAGAMVVEVIGDVDPANAPLFTDLADDITRDRPDRGELDLAGSPPSAPRASALCCTPVTPSSRPVANLSCASRRRRSDWCSV
jgi:hypothetical protein